MISGLFWNVRGVGNSSSLRRIKRLLRLHRFSLLALFEPMIPAARITDIQHQLHFDHCLFSHTNKIWQFWTNDLRVNLLDNSDQYLHAEILDAQDIFLSFLTVVYAKCSRSDRISLWASLLSLGQHIDSLQRPWLVGGDFNAISSLEEHVGRSSPDLGSMRDFSNFITDCGLLELPTSGGPFTWTGVRHSGRVWKRLDRLLVNHFWSSTDWQASVDILSRTTSDHSPLLLKVDRPDSHVPRPFRFQNFWLGRSDFMPLVEANWSLPVDFHGSYRFAWKLKRLKGALKEWNKSVVGNIFYNLKQAEVQVNSLQSHFDASGLDADLLRLNEAQAHYLRALSDEESYWKQRARVKWLHEGDLNTKFFHATTKEKRNLLYYIFLGLRPLTVFGLILSLPFVTMPSLFIKIC